MSERAETASEEGPGPAKAGRAEVEDDRGVDVAQILDMLARTPEERLEALRCFAGGLVELADAARRP